MSQKRCDPTRVEQLAADFEANYNELIALETEMCNTLTKGERIDIDEIVVPATNAATGIARCTGSTALPPKPVKMRPELYVWATRLYSLSMKNTVFWRDHPEVCMKVALRCSGVIIPERV